MEKERELEVQRWVLISIERKTAHYRYERLFSYDLPVEVFMRRRWVIEWRRAKLVCRYPKDNVRCFMSYYDRRLGMDTRLSEDLRRLASAKAQVAKAQRAIDAYVVYSRAHDLFFDEDTDESLRKAREKLAAKIAAVQTAEEKLSLAITSIHAGCLLPD